MLKSRQHEEYKRYDLSVIIRFKNRVNNKHNIILVIIDGMILFLKTFKKCQKFA